MYFPVLQISLPTQPHLYRFYSNAHWPFHRIDKVLLGGGGVLPLSPPAIHANAMSTAVVGFFGAGRAVLPAPHATDHATTIAGAKHGMQRWDVRLWGRA